MDLDSIQNLGQIKALLVVLCLAVLWSWEGWWPLFTGRRDRTRHALRNVSFALVNTLLIVAMFAAATAWMANWVEERRIGLLNYVQPVWVQVGLALILLDLWMYLWHRLNHAVPLLWRFHRTHHSDSEVDVTTGLRFHLGELAISAALRLGLIVLLGLRLEWILLYEIMLLPVVLFHHSNVGLAERWDRLLRWVIVTPNMHRVHHSNLRPETDSNFSSVLSLWDRLFQTLRWRRDPRTIEFGLKEFAGPSWQTWSGMWRTPLAGRSRYEEDSEASNTAGIPPSAFRRITWPWRSKSSLPKP